MFSKKKRYKTYNNKFSIMAKVFNIWEYNFENCKYEVFIFIKDNNYYYFIKSKKEFLLRFC